MACVTTGKWYLSLVTAHTVVFAMVAVMNRHYNKDDPAIGVLRSVPLYVRVMNNVMSN
jgi:hypothetical protein